MPFAAAACAVGEFVCLVSNPGIPAEIGEAIVDRLAVAVTALHAFRAGAYEGFKHEAMDPACPLLAVATEVDHEMARAVSCLLQDTPLPAATI
jgi:hypothetical protein